MEEGTSSSILCPSGERLVDGERRVLLGVWDFFPYSVSLLYFLGLSVRNKSRGSNSGNLVWVTRRLV